MSSVRGRRKAYYPLILALVIGALLVAWVVLRDSTTTTKAGVLERACDLRREELIRVWRGYHPTRSEDIMFVPDAPNYVGSFDLTSHSGPWRYLQEIPLLFYGPRRIEDVGHTGAAANITDVYPTIGRLTDVALPARDGDVLEEALIENVSGRPRLVVVVVWDGAGARTLERWPHSWPVLKKLQREGAFYDQAVVGSSPSITTAVHSSLATGAWPRAHGIVGNSLRKADGTLAGTFSELRPDDLKLPTFADQIDVRLDNRPRVALLGWTRWHLGLLGHGSSLPQSDADELALIHFNGKLRIHGNASLFNTPTPNVDLNIEELLDTLDRGDGTLDGRWLGNDISLPEGPAPWNTYSNPAWVRYQAEVALSMLRSGYGSDHVPDLFLTNFKMTDLAGHTWGLNSPETKAVLRAQDAALGQIVRYLDRKVNDYVLVLTADHGSAPLANESGAWPIQMGELLDDLNEVFDVPSSEDLIESSSAYGLYVRREVAEELGVTPDDVARYLNDYTIAANSAGPSPPEDYEDRAGERIFSAVFPSRRLPEVMDCALHNGDS